MRKVTANRNCWSGMQTIGTSGSNFEEDIWVNNAAGSNGAACGGICLFNSNKNVLRKSTFYGNGSVDYANGNVDFGAGFEGSSPATAPCPNIRTEGVEEAASRVTIPVHGVKGLTAQLRVQTAPAIASLLAVSYEKPNWQRKTAMALLSVAFLVTVLISSGRSRKLFSKL